MAHRKIEKGAGTGVEAIALGVKRTGLAMHSLRAQCLRATKEILGIRNPIGARRPREHEDRKSKGEGAAGAQHQYIGV